MKHTFSITILSILSFLFALNIISTISTITVSANTPQTTQQTNKPQTKKQTNEDKISQVSDKIQKWIVEHVTGFIASIGLTGIIIILGFLFLFAEDS